MNTTPNPNYPLPEKWYVRRTLENAEKLNNLLNTIFKGTGKTFSNGTKEKDYTFFKNKPTSRHFIHNIFKESSTKPEPQPGYTEVTYEDLWLVYMIPEKWYCVDIDSENFIRWRKLNNNFNIVTPTKSIVLSKHLRDNTYYWGGYVENLKRDKSYKGYKEISKETYLKLLNILEQKKNSNNMSSKTETMLTEVIIPLIKFKKIIDVACTYWQGRLKDYILENLQNDCVSVKITKDFYDQMIKASTKRNGVNQADVINSVLPMFKDDPYKVFKDALSEGKIVQFKIPSEGIWGTPIISRLDFIYPPENYRIKHKHQDLIDEWEASGRTKEVEYQPYSKKWILTKDPVWNEETEYRFKPETKYVPFTFEDAEFLIGKAIKSKDNTVYDIITYINNTTRVNTGYGPRSFDELLESFVFLDGTPCGKLVTE